MSFPAISIYTCLVAVLVFYRINTVKFLIIRTKHDTIICGSHLICQKGVIE